MVKSQLIQIAMLGNHNKPPKPVIQESINGIYINRYESITIAGIMTGINPGNITSCCRGRLHSAGGYKWRYENE